MCCQTARTLQTPCSSSATSAQRRGSCSTVLVHHHCIAYMQSAITEAAEAASIYIRPGKRLQPAARGRVLAWRRLPHRLQGPECEPEGAGGALVAAALYHHAVIYGQAVALARLKCETTRRCRRAGHVQVLAVAKSTQQTLFNQTHQLQPSVTFAGQVVA